MELGFTEHLVARERTAGVKLREGLTLTACLLVTLALCLLAWIFLFDSPGFAAAFCAFFALVCFLVWRRLRAHFYVEFEYCIVADEMTLSRILGKARRKQLTVIALRNVTRLAPVKDCLSQIAQADDVLDASSGTEGDAERYCLLFEDGKGKHAVVFNAPEAVRKAMRPYCLRAMS